MALWPSGKRLDFETVVVGSIPDTVDYSIIRLTEIKYYSKTMFDKLICLIILLNNFYAFASFVNLYVISIPNYTTPPPPPSGIK